MNNDLIKIEHVTYKYERENVLEDINLSVKDGDFLAIVGPNGSGKSTLLKLMLGLNKVQQGEIFLFGEKINKFKNWEKIGYVSQKANSFNSGFPATVEEVVASGLTKKIGLFRFYNKTHRQKVVKALKEVGMQDFIKRPIGELSGGQQQRVFIARALVSDPAMLILDEPTVGVDVKNVTNFYDLLYDLNRNLGLTLILVTHDTGTITEKVTHIACLNKQLHFHGNTCEYEHLDDKDMSAFYGHDVYTLTHDH
ncbi:MULTISPECIES: metal ABC transporter ATP-binding protein [unclassified Bacillus (in: firmicutes)]|uniref:metal ABC transporter ATP-binding protein n=1 Tax=unclassified Bacillus (in: firmicutes) TaxID=185979 RepID=UPI00080ACEA7|nr:MULTISPECIES: metal ABC transporter ATP-binding protein [unclassified Bacillus (in: firmicutes)]OCA86416.1 zinc ABC transporter ATP-binding protein [Bacillus sp. FJAT-27986]